MSVVSFGTVIVLLALVLFIRRRLRTSSQHAWAGAALLLLVAAVFTYFSFSDYVRGHTYLYPPVAPQEASQKPYVQGAVHEAGKERMGTDSVAMAVSRLGGPGMVDAHQLLWTTEARSLVVGAMVRYYAAVAFLMTTALLVISITVWRTFHDRPAHEQE